MPFGQRSRLTTQQPKTGDKTLCSYSALNAGGSLQSVIRNLDEDKLLVNDRMDNFMHFSETFNGIELHYWLNKQVRIIKKPFLADCPFILSPN